MFDVSRQFLGGLGEPDQVHPARHIAQGDALGAKLPRTQQGGNTRGGRCAQLGNVAAQEANEILHVGSALRQWRIFAQYQRHRLQRGHHVITLPRRRVSDVRLPRWGTHELAAFWVRVQRKAHATTPVRIKPK